MQRHRLLVLIAALPLNVATPAKAADVASLQGRFDNQAQVSSAPADASPPIPLTSVTIEPTPTPSWFLWHVRVATDAEHVYEQTWAMETRIHADKSGELVPYYQLRQETTPSAAAFDPKGWLSLEACALRGAFDATPLEATAEGEPCVAVSMSIGARRALLPVGVELDGDALRLYMDLLGTRMRIDAKRSR